MIFDRFRADMDLHGNGFIGFAGNDKLKNFQFPRGKIRKTGSIHFSLEENLSPFLHTGVFLSYLAD
jgi:hypothetical protein